MNIDSIDSKCTNCNNRVKVTKKNEIINEVRVYFLECNSCKKRFLIYAEDSEVKEELEKMHDLLMQYLEHKGAKKMKYWELICEQKKKNRILMNAKNQKYEKIIKEVIDK